MEALIVLWLLIMTGGIGFIAIRQHQMNLMLVSSQRQQKQATDAESVIRETLGSLSANEWKEITEGKMDTFQQKVQARFTKAPAPARTNHLRPDLEKRIALLDAAAEEADKVRINLSAMGCPTLANQQKRDAAGYRREADSLRAQLA